MSQLGINFVHVISFSNVQNFFFISVMNAMVWILGIFAQDEWSLEWILPEVHISHDVMWAN